jgi:hypothetical protein
MFRDSFMRLVQEIGTPLSILLVECQGFLRSPFPEVWALDRGRMIKNHMLNNLRDATSKSYNKDPFTY